MALRLDTIALAEQPGEAGMRDRNVQPVGIIVAHVLPVYLARAQRDAAQRLEFAEAIGRDHGFVRRHHRGHRSPAIILEPYEDKAAPDLHLDRREACLTAIQRGVAGAVGYAGESPVTLVGPGVIGADRKSTRLNSS